MHLRDLKRTLKGSSVNGAITKRRGGEGRLEGGGRLEGYGRLEGWGSLEGWGRLEGRGAEVRNDSVQYKQRSTCVEKWDERGCSGNLSFEAALMDEP